MKKLFFLLSLLFIGHSLNAQRVDSLSMDSLYKTQITHRIDSSVQGEIVLIEEVLVHASLKKVWEAYTTSEGWEAWAVPLANVVFKIGGQIQTNYNPYGKLGDETTTTLHIINYVPYELITLQAEFTKNFPEFMKKDEKNMFNVITFDYVDENETLITSYGIGYRNTPKYLGMLNFFIEGNEKTYMKLLRYLEEGKKATYKR